MRITNSIMFCVVLSAVVLLSSAVMGDPIARKSNVLTERELMDIFHVKSLDHVPDYEVIYPEITNEDMVFTLTNKDQVEAETLHIRFDAFDENLQVTVQQDSSGFSPDFIMEEISPAGKKEVPVCLRCLYSGKVKGEPDSVVAVTMLAGMQAIMYHASGPTLVSPLSSDHALSKRGLGLAHIAYRNKTSVVVNICGRQATPLDLPTGLPSELDEELNTEPFNQKRQAAAKRLELALFGDYTIYNNGADHTTGNMLTLYIEARKLLQLTSLHDNFKVTLVYGGYFTEASDLRTVSDGSTTLRLVSNDQSRRNPSNQQHWDNAAYITRHDLTDSNPDIGTGLLGRAYIGYCANSRYAASITEVRDNQMAAATLAHEIGHNLGIRHDGDGNACASNQNIMASRTASRPYTTWSSCSKNQFATRLSQTGCYND